MWFKHFLWRLFDALLLYPRWLISNPFAPIDEHGHEIAPTVPPYYEWVHTAFVSAFLNLVVLSTTPICLVLSIVGRPFGTQPLLWGLGLYLTFGLYFLARSMLCLLGDLASDAVERVMD